MSWLSLVASRIPCFLPRVASLPQPPLVSDALANGGEPFAGRRKAPACMLCTAFSKKVLAQTNRGTEQYERRPYSDQNAYLVGKQAQCDTFRYALNPSRAKTLALLLDFSGLGKSCNFSSCVKLSPVLRNSRLRKGAKGHFGNFVASTQPGIESVAVARQWDGSGEAVRRQWKGSGTAVARQWGGVARRGWDGMLKEQHHRVPPKVRFLCYA